MKKFSDKFTEVMNEPLGFTIMSIVLLIIALIVNCFISYFTSFFTSLITVVLTLGILGLLHQLIFPKIPLRIGKVLSYSFSIVLFAITIVVFSNKEFRNIVYNTLEKKPPIYILTITKDINGSK